MIMFGDEISDSSSVREQHIIAQKKVKVGVDIPALLEVTLMSVNSEEVVCLSSCGSLAQHLRIHSGVIVLTRYLSPFIFFKICLTFVLSCYRWNGVIS